MSARTLISEPPLWRFPVLAAAMSLQLMTDTLHAQPADVNRDVIAVVNRMAADIKVTVIPEGEEATLLADPLMSYSDETRYIKQSVLRVWTFQGAPVLFQKIEVNTRYEKWRVTHCSGSLGNSLKVTFPNRSDAFEATPVPFKKLTDVTVTSETRANLKLRALARQFSVVTDDTVTHRELRLLPRPLMTYQSPEQGIKTGAVFGYAFGTNPDVLIAIQQRDNHWEYAPIRMTSAGIELRMEDELYWSDESKNRVGDFGHWCYFHGEWPESTQP